MTRLRLAVLGLTCILALLGWRLWPVMVRALAVPPTEVERQRAITRTLAALARESHQSVAVLTEADAVDALVMQAAGGTTPVAIVPRDPDAVARAARERLLLAGLRGREYLETLGYQLRWLPQDPAAPSFPWARVNGRLTCAAVRADRWSPLPGLEYTGRLGLVLPAAPGGALALIVGDTVPPQPDVQAPDDRHLRVRRDPIGSHADLPPDFWLEGGTPLDAPPHVQAMSISASPQSTRVISVRLGRRAPRVLARLRGFPDAARASVCAAPIGADPLTPDATLVVLASMPEYFGVGWTEAMSVPATGSARWLHDQAALLIPSTSRTSVRVEVDAVGADDLGMRARVSLRVNDTVDAGEHAARAGRQRYEWIVPAQAWPAGTNELLLRVAGAGGERAIAVSRVTLAATR